MSINVFVLFLRMKSRAISMPVRKSEYTASSVKKVSEPVAEKPRKFADVVKEIRKLREKGKTVPQIAEELTMSYTVVKLIKLCCAPTKWWRVLKRCLSGKSRCASLTAEHEKAPLRGLVSSASTRASQE